MLIRYLAAPAGAGKTYAIQTECNRLINDGEFVILCQPTKRLIDETSTSLQSRYPNLHCRIIHEDNCKGTVAGSIIDYLRNPYPEPHVLIITWEAFQRLKFIPNRTNWTLIVDEIPQAYDCFDEVLPNTHQLVTTHLMTRHSICKGYSDLFCLHRKSIRTIAENKGKDKALRVFQKLAVRLDSEHWLSYVDTTAYERLLSPGTSATRLTVFSFLKPTIFDGFKSVTIAGACFEDSILCRSFTNKGVTFQDAKEMTNSLQFVEHQNGESVTVLYATDKKWSKRFRDSDNGNVWSKIVDAVKDEFGTEDFVWSANKDIPDNTFSHSNRLPQSPHGLNSFDHIDNVAFLSAHNLIPAHAKFIETHLSISRDEIDTAIHRQHAYQAIMRCSIRNLNNQNPRKIFVPDLPTAQWLHEQFPGSQLRHLDCGLGSISIPKRGRPKKHKSSGARDDAYRQKLKDQLSKHLQTLFPNKNDPHCDTQNSFDENAILKSNFVDQHRVSIFRNKQAKEACQTIEASSLVEFEELLKELSKRAISEKENNLLLYPSIFDPKLSTETSRGRANFVTANGIWLDFDGGDLGPKKFSELFRNLRMTIYSTHSSTKKQFRFRVFIPTSSPLTIEAYEAIAHQILSNIIEAGYGDKKGNVDKTHGLDTSKLSPISLFYLPCRPADKDGAFFKTYKDKARQPLDVNELLDIVKAPDAEYADIESPENAPTMIHSDRIQSAIDQWQAISKVPGKGNNEFFRLAGRLAAAGCSDAAMHNHLIAQSAFARDPAERIKEIPKILASLRKKGAFINSDSSRPISEAA
jgi:hypothetical protein